MRVPHNEACLQDGHAAHDRNDWATARAALLEADAQERRAAWLADDEFWTTRLSQYVVKANGTVPEALRSAIEKVQDVPRFDTYKNEWTKISGGVRTD